MRSALVLFAIAAGCGDNINGDIAIVSATWTEPLGEFVELSHSPQLSFIEVDSADVPTADVAGYQIVVVDDPAIPLEGYRVDAAAGTLRTWSVHAHDALGAQYGVAAALENLGYRWRHPFDPYVPYQPKPGSATIGDVHQPETRVRGFHLHTLHPIEPYYALWEGDVDRSREILDWIIKNRGNYVQWAALGNIVHDPDAYAAWRSATAEIIDAAHRRGMRIGINIQLFGASNLQQAFDLVDDASGSVPDQIAARLPLVTDGLAFDVYNLSFGEFFDAQPQAFIDAVNEVRHQLAARAPNAEMHALVHVGATQRVTYMGKDMLYYFLVQYADPSIIPEIHSVMYYDLFEDAGGAYQHQDFSEHRQYLVDRLCSNQRAGYHPETAYWIAFDDSVPLFLPIYVRTRWTDLSKIRLAAPPPCSPLDDHLIFSSGWEWGYWLHDVTAMRASYELPAAPADAIADALAPDLGLDAAAVISDLADAQHDALIGARLAPYLAGRDALIDAGRSINVISQPDRITFDDLVAAMPDARAAFDANVLGPLADHAATVDALAARLDALHLPTSRWSNELADGVIAVYRATLAHLDGDDDSAKHARADAAAALDQATGIVARRHADRHDASDRLVTGNDVNSTVYSYGYLYTADTLCYWNRELIQVDAIIANSNVTPPACVL
jgi:hypothetical protein